MPAHRFVRPTNNTDGNVPSEAGRGRARLTQSLDGLWRDLRFALRSLKRAPGFTATAILIIATGIGANTAVFSVVDTVLLKPLSYPDPQALVQLVITSDRGSIPVASIPEYNAWRQQTAIFQHVAAYDWGGAGMNLTGGDQPEQVLGVHVTSDYFTLFGAPVVAGRTFTAEEDTPHGGHVAVFSDGLWKRRFGGDPRVVGSTVQVNGEPYVVLGVIGSSFVSESPVDLWIPFQFDLTSQEMARHFNAAARLRPGVTRDQANAALALAAGEFRRNHGTRALPPHGGFEAVPLLDQVVGNTRGRLIVLAGAVCLVLLLACANVANLLLVRASVRRREFATRAALGAATGQLVRHVLTESLVLSLAGGLLGLALGFAGVRMLLLVSPGDIPRIGEAGSAVGLDGRVALFTLVISLLAGALFGLVPALTVSGTRPIAGLKGDSSRSGTGLQHNRIRSLLAVGEVALALVLVIGAGLLIRTFVNLYRVDPGFTTNNVLSASMSINGSRFQTTEPVAQLVRNGRESLLTVPGVLDASASSCLPLQGCFGMGFDIVGRPKGEPGAAGLFSISWSYFSTLQVPVLRGRAFTTHDDGAASGVVIINQAMVRRYWPTGDPLNDRIQIGAGGPAFAEPPRQIVGIVGDTRDAGLSREPFPTMYIPLAQMPDAETALNSKVAPLWWIVRSRVDPHTLRAPVGAALREASGGLPVARLRTMAELAARNTARQRFNMLLLSLFGAAGLLMATIGVGAVMAYSVQQRRRELGVRVALGAEPTDLRNMVIRQGMGLVVLGVVLGMSGAFGLARFLASFLFGVNAWDPLTFIATPILLGAVSLMAVAVPAWRATRIDPVTSLRLD